MLLSKIGRTKIESKSQQMSSNEKRKYCCYQRSEEQRLKANHNFHHALHKKHFVVIKDRKNKDWKQITTIHCCSLSRISLLSKIGRTKIESKSQLHWKPYQQFFCCYQRSEEQRLKANHNLSPLLVLVSNKN